MGDFRKFQPHRRISLSDICRLITVSSRLGRLATGLETLQRPAAPTGEPQMSFQEALEKLNGCQEMTAENGPTGTETV